MRCFDLFRERQSSLSVLLGSDDREGIITDLRASKLHHHETDWPKGNALDML
jgi:hypothetical protein